MPLPGTHRPSSASSRTIQHAALWQDDKETAHLQACQPFRQYHMHATVEQVMNWKNAEKQPCALCTSEVHWCNQRMALNTSKCLEPLSGGDPPLRGQVVRSAAPPMRLLPRQVNQPDSRPPLWLGGGCGSCLTPHETKCYMKPDSPTHVYRSACCLTSTSNQAVQACKKPGMSMHSHV